MARKKLLRSHLSKHNTTQHKHKPTVKIIDREYDRIVPGVDEGYGAPYEGLVRYVCQWIQIDDEGLRQTGQLGRQLILEIEQRGYVTVPRSDRHQPRTGVRRERWTQGTGILDEVFVVHQGEGH